MHLSDEEKLSILEESRDLQFQRDVKLLSSESRKLSLEEYLDFLNAVSKMTPHPARPHEFVQYHTVIF